MPYLSLSPVTEALIALLTVPDVTDLATGGIDEGFVRGRTGARLWLELLEEEARGFGTGSLPAIELRVHVVVPVDVYRGQKLAQQIAQAVIALLRDASLTVDGYASCGRVLYDRTVPAPGEIVEGVVVNELVVFFRFWLEEA